MLIRKITKYQGPETEHANDEILGLVSNGKARNVQVQERKPLFEQCQAGDEQYNVHRPEQALLTYDQGTFACRPQDEREQHRRLIRIRQERKWTMRYGGIDTGKKYYLASYVMDSWWREGDPAAEQANKGEMSDRRIRESVYLINILVSCHSSAKPSSITLPHCGGVFYFTSIVRAHGENILLISGKNYISCSFKSVYKTQNGF